MEGLDVSVIPKLYTWIKGNKLLFIVITMTLLAVYSSYEFLGGYMKPLGERLGERSRDDFPKAAAAFSSLDVIITHDLQNYHASRVGLTRFHDSQRDMSGMSYFYASVANMVAAPGITLNMTEVANLQMVVYTPIMPTLLQNQVATVIVKDLPQGPMKELLINRGTEVALYVPISDLSGNIVGFLWMGWIKADEVPKGDDQKKMITQLQNDATRIGGYFSIDKGK